MKRVVACLLLVTAACGKRGDPHPPVPVIPRATSDLVVAQRGPQLILSWSYPSLTTSGQKLPAIRRVVLYRYIENLPVTTEPPPDIDPTIPRPIALFAKIPPIGPMQFGKLRERLASIEAPDLATATVGARLVYEDAPPLLTKDGRPVRIEYAVVTEGESARSAASNIASIVPLNVAQPPTEVKIEARPEGLVLTWKAPEKAIEGDEKPRVVGYDIYRYPPKETIEELATAVNAVPISSTTYTDVPAYGDYAYRVAAVTAAGPPRLESEPSEEAQATYKDLLPPSAPSGLAALVEPKAVRLVWDAVDTPDLAGYRVYRTEGKGEKHQIVGRLLFTPQLIHETNWRDTLADPGIYYFYEVTAVDKNGNESAPAKTDWVFVPKTP